MKQALQARHQCAQGDQGVSRDVRQSLVDTLTLYLLMRLFCHIDVETGCCASQLLSTIISAAAAAARAALVSR